MGIHSQCLREWENPFGDMTWFFQEVKIIHTNRGPEIDGEKVVFLCGKVATLYWDLDRWWWIDGGHFLNYTSKDGQVSVISRNPGTTCAVDKWQGYLMGNHRFYWS